MKCTFSREMTEKRCLKNMKEALAFFGQKAAECCSCPCETGLMLKKGGRESDQKPGGQSGRPCAGYEVTGLPHTPNVVGKPAPPSKKTTPRKRYLSFMGGQGNVVPNQVKTDAVEAAQPQPDREPLPPTNELPKPTEKPPAEKRKRGRPTHYFKDGYPLLASSLGWDRHKSIRNPGLAMVGQRREERAA
jgi:hypothetical protein